MQCNLRLVVKIAFEHAHFSSIPIMDLISAGNVGLAKATDKFRPRQYKTKFSTYAIWWIRQSIRRTLHQFSDHVHIPSHIMENARKYSKMLTASHNKPLTDVECMRELSISAESLHKIQQAKTHLISLDQPISDDDNSPSHAEIIADEAALIPSVVVEAKDMHENVMKALDELGDMERDIVVSQCMSPNKTELRKLGKRYGLTGERIRQIKQEALNSLKRSLSRKTLIGSNFNDSASKTHISYIGKRKRTASRK
jgi:RNA polymerase primary sigma factor